ncbi:MAG TPA: DinB family protein [Chitinophagaceae bacterium]|jgi:uncharacterized damage-inducible protein DinB|nr:DinB family protein [Chitinophagaceae bacterium]
MTLLQFFRKQLDAESIVTRKMLERVPADRFDWQPHPKSMTLKRLAVHLAELPSWIPMTLDTSELDFATAPYTPVPVQDEKDLLRYFEESLAAGQAGLAGAREEQFPETWVLRDGATIYSTSTKGEVLSMTLSQIIHHRAQLGVYLRLLNIPIPGAYGPSADEMEAMAETAAN